MLNYFFKITAGLSKALSYVGGLVLFALMLLTAIDVTGRYLFNTPFIGTYEITKFMLASLIFCSLAYTQSRKGHVAVDIFVSGFSPKHRIMIDLINHSISSIVLGAIAWKSVERGFEVMATKECSGTLGIPVYPFLFVVAFGSAALCMEFLKDAIMELRGNNQHEA